MRIRIEAFVAGYQLRRRRASLLADDTGSGGSLLVITSEQGSSRYLTEILRAEGFSSFRATGVASLTTEGLTGFDTVLLGAVEVDSDRVRDLAAWVEAGGSLVALRPGPSLAPLLGLEWTGSSQLGGYLQVDTQQPPGIGISDRLLQVHGDADHHRIADAVALAALHGPDRASTGFPAVTLRDVGSSGGRAAAFTYDLAASIVQTRQGNPRWAGQNRDGDLLTRSDDLFFGAADTDPRPDWVDRDLLDVPQADEQQRLLAQLLQHLSTGRRPLLRFWYLPRDLQAAVVMTGDDHAMNGTLERFRDYAALDRPGDSPDDWTAVRATSYLFADASLTDAEAAGLEAAGFEICPHVTTGGTEWTPSSLARAYQKQVRRFTQTYPSVAPPATHRLHAVVWSDWATQAEVERANGIRLDTNYYLYPPPWVRGGAGLFTGSGLVMRFADEHGQVIDCYQAVTLLTDESEQLFPDAAVEALDRALRPDGHVEVITANMHTDLAASIGSDAIITAARQRGVPVISARQLLLWLEGRARSAVTHVDVIPDGLTFTLARDPGARHLMVHVPLPEQARGAVRATRDGHDLPLAYEVVGGVTHLSLPADTGQYEIGWSDQPPDTSVHGLRALTRSSSEATISWRTHGPTAGQVSLVPADGGAPTTIAEPVARTQHAVAVPGLRPGTTYRVVVDDAPADGLAEVALTMPEEPVVHDRVAHLSGGTFDGTTLSAAHDGCIILRPELSLEPALRPSLDGWAADDVDAQAGDASLLVRGSLLADGCLEPGRSFEVGVLITPEGRHVIGFSDGIDGGTHLAFTTDPVGRLSASVCVDGQVTLHPIPGDWTRSPHRLRIDWDAGLSTFGVDGRNVVSARTRVDRALRPVISSSDDADGLQVHWARASSFGRSGSYTSPVIDGGRSVGWGSASLRARALTMTGARIATRVGSSAVPDDAWSPWLSSDLNGARPPTRGRFVQYRLELLTGSRRWTPEILGITLSRYR